MVRHRLLLALMTATVLLTAAARVPAEGAYPPGVPDLTDHDVQDGLVVLAISLLDGDPHFPVLVLAGSGGGLPRYLLVVVDTRSGKDAWSLQEDHPILFMVFSSSTELRGAYLDEGFAANGKASGHFSGAGPEAVERLVGELRDGHRRARRLVVESNGCETVPHAGGTGWHHPSS
ncbi:MAG TPA: hypothetical protein VLH58_03140 [Candidatus Methylomirabilis sp.]|nr:hypothetical protein [Candidatus Methylomirabilis sp.]HSC70317.1 hypothetical protein [Candidatus Methylomirabilis sp.]